VIVTAVVVIGVVGYLAWFMTRPNPGPMSERIVRDARHQLALEARTFERKLDALMRDSKNRHKDIGAEIDKHLEEAVQAIDTIVEQARDQISDLDLGRHTQHNRMNRVEGRGEDAKVLVRQLAEQAKQKALGG